MEINNQKHHVYRKMDKLVYFALWKPNYVTQETVTVILTKLEKKMNETGMKRKLGSWSIKTSQVNQPKRLLFISFYNYSHNNNQKN